MNIMNDGRLFTNYNSDGDLTNKIKQKNSIKNNEDYRKFLVHNADLIMKTNKNLYSQQNFEYKINNDPNHIFMNLKPTNKNVPHLYSSHNDNRHPFGYETNPVKEKYLSREHLNSKKLNKYKI